MTPSRQKPSPVKMEENLDVENGTVRVGLDRVSYISYIDDHRVTGYKSSRCEDQSKDEGETQESGSGL